MISDITQKLGTDKNTIKGLMRNIIDDSETRRIMVNVLDKTFNDILDGSMIIKVPKPDKDLIVSRSELAETTKAFTKLLNRFYQIEASEGTMSLIEETKAKQTRMSGKEVALESGRGASSSPQMSMSEGGQDSSSALLLQYLPQFTKKLDALNNALSQLDLSGGSSGGGGLAGEVMDEAGDALGGRRKRSSDNSSTRGPSARGGGPRPAQPAGGGGMGLLKLVGLGAAIYAAPKLAEMAGDAFSAGTNFLSNTISTVAKKAESILASIGQAAGGLIDAGGAALGAGGGEYAAVGAGGQGAWASDAPFIQAVNDLAQKYNIDANDLIGLMQSESGVNPQARNPNGGATGLIQFMPNTARGIGTSTDALYGMNRAQQMVWVDRYFQANRLPRGATAGNLYASVFLPAYTSRPPNFVVARNGGPNDAGANRSGSWYSANRGLDLNNDGTITIAELGERVSKKRQEIGLGPSRIGGGFRAAINTVTNAATNVGQAAIGAAGEAGGMISRGVSNAMGFIKPVGNARVSSGFGMRRHPTLGTNRQHNGVDYAIPMGTPILAIADGTVAKADAGFNGGGGWTLGINHDNGYYSGYAHLSRFLVAPGTRVRQNQPVALSGGARGHPGSGRSTGAHLHFGIRRGGGWINPLSVLGGASVLPPEQGNYATEEGAVRNTGNNNSNITPASAPVENPASAFAQRLIAALDERVPIPTPATARLPAEATNAAINRRLNDTPRVVVVDRPVAQPSPPPTVTSLGDMQTPPKSNHDLATQYRVYFGVA
jgi:murein DD-endopeptidase MepM/ murein hydrolase activator NlpD